MLIPQVGFLPPDDARVQGTVAAIERRLLRSGFVLRYDTAATEDGLPPGEGAFLPSSFWLADAYVMIGRTADAQRLFKRLIGLCNDVGLLAEEYDVGAQRLLGNFPQAFSHIALINTAYNLDHAAQAVRAAFRAQTDRRPIEALPASARTGGTIVGGGNARKTH